VALRRMTELKPEETENLQKSDPVSLRDNILHMLWKYESITLRYKHHF
jgi:hypothetical protein